MQLNKYSLILFLPALFVVFAGLFYWYEYRPSEIPRECSWAPYNVPATEAFAGITKEEAERKNTEMSSNCQGLGDEDKFSEFNNRYSDNRSWESLNKQAREEALCKTFIIEATEEAPRPAEPERTAWRQATDREYTQCLRNNGL
jgi:hypothetical protein